MELVYKYERTFRKLKVAKVKGFSAPHKPILLLAIIESIERREINENKIYITPELVATFKDLWHRLVHNNVFTPNFSLPFFHLKSNNFWHLQTHLGREILLTASHSIKSFAHLKEVVNFAFFNEDLFMLLMDAPCRYKLQQLLLSTYFPGVNKLTTNNEIIATISKQILHESPAAYRSKSATFDEEEVFIRGGVFKKEIPRIYNYTCCISGMRIIADKEVQMIDACHIVPFSESGDDTIGNGISLCPNLHRAFDRGLISISSDYRVLVKPFHEVDSNSYSIKQFEGKEILLPGKKQYHPLSTNLLKHRERFGFT